MPVGSAPEYVTIIYNSSFSGTAAGLLTEADLRALEDDLVANPRIGVVIPGTLGVRKVRVAQEGRGKRGAARVIYLYIEVQGRIYLLLAYGKNVQETLTAEQKRALRTVAAQLKQRGQQS